ncbi:MAG: sucrose-specific PTS transporter subunit IIBC [Lactococcus raffinolactis]|jgi:sucrose PTS system EIIBCA or EIIBC component|uniref:protein-N(pi)-phosphohistidine--sucrose phosphotransferase n=1 Tax=Pseudolactococcus raffinolactis TaxID=1366 RepID=A0A2A5SB83_9LACT|nr:sucrose-specific PTS transporter subunit IIBC [Lactococcus raffinolactis]MBP6984865.1 PTS transporter subunit EIIC [Lactococcus sp.]ATC60407.1 PTS beta-glucoside transporter subunit EIIBCA [Lactococcus raffinolactis]MBQ6144329.1 PTS transporter subunit EIIC [Lactococcus sp.]MBW9330226.1 PTS beta-glucoside transporter subunit EIIBCA [Lactococcus raffinolactis]MDG4961107.1 sucrose-specific PTS transporter subunit IIBC [Lactococcus raffinolactis]
MDHKEVAKRVAAALGEDNLVAAAHCATRLRLVVKDTANIDQAALDDDADLKGTFEANGQYQIIVGPGDVNTVYKELVAITGVGEVSKDELKDVANTETNPLMKLIKVLSDIFVPLIPALVAGGLLMALNNVLTGQGLFGPQSIVEMVPGIQGFAEIVNLMASAPFAFLPILIGFSATKRFGGNPYLGAAAGMMLVMPSLVNGYGVAEAIASNKMPYWDVFGFKIAQAGYQGQVLPVIGVAWILATLEKFFHKHLKNAIDFTFTPMLAVIITGFVTFAVVGPVLRGISNGMTDGLVWLVNTLGGVGYGIFGLGYSAIVLTGLHQSFPAIETSLLADIAKTGGDFIFPIAAAANVAQGAATFAIFFLTKNEKQKGLASSSAFSAMLGITEPAMFGVNLKLKFPFFIGLGAAGIASTIMGFAGVRGVSLGPAGIIGFIAIKPASIPMFMLGIAVSFVLAFLATYIYGKGRMDVPANVATTGTTAQDINIVKTSEGVLAEELFAPVTGQAIQLSETKDQVFSSGLMGKGIAIEPTVGEIYAPADGTLTVTNDSKHAYGLLTANGAEVLLHIGIDTVQMAGDGFSTQVKQGQVVKKGDLLGTFNIDKIKAAGYEATVMVIVTNTMSFAEVQGIDNQTVTVGQAIIQTTAPVAK